MICGWVVDWMTISMREADHLHHLREDAYVSELKKCDELERKIIDRCSPTEVVWSFKSNEKALYIGSTIFCGITKLESLEKAWQWLEDCE